MIKNAALPKKWSATRSSWCTRSASEEPFTGPAAIGRRCCFRFLERTLSLCAIKRRSRGCTASRARTYVQRNRGFRACPKTRNDGRRVDATNQDIVHAYRAVLERERDTTDPVLVFEDDARLTSTAKEDLEIVDRFVSTQRFSVYSLGSMGLMVPHREKGHVRLLGRFFAFVHAVIYSPPSVRAILETKDVGPREHID